MRRFISVLLFVVVLPSTVFTQEWFKIKLGDISKYTPGSGGKGEPYALCSYYFDLKDKKNCGVYSGLRIRHSYPRAWYFKKNFFTPVRAEQEKFYDWLLEKHGELPETFIVYPAETSNESTTGEVKGRIRFTGNPTWTANWDIHGRYIEAPCALKWLDKTGKEIA